MTDRTIAPLSGAGYLLQGMGLIARPGIRRFVLVPLIINILVFGAAIRFLLARLEEGFTWIESQLPSLPDWLSWLQQGLESALWFLALLSLVFIALYSFTLVANLIAAPFNDRLAERVEDLLTGRVNRRNVPWHRTLLGWIPGLFGELGKLLYALLWAIPFFLVSVLIPLVGPLIWFGFTAWILALQYLDFPLGNQGIGFRDLRRWSRRRLPLVLGFGGAAAVLTLIPLVNFIVMPSAVAGATALWIDHREADSSLAANQTT